MPFGIKHLLVLIAVVAVGLAGLLNARWPAAVVAVQLLAILVVVAMAYGAWFSTGAARAFRVGFLGWWLLYSVPILGLTLPSAATKALLNQAAPVFRPTDFAQPVVSAGSSLSISGYVPPASPWPPVNQGGVQDTISVTLPADPVFAPSERHTNGRDIRQHTNVPSHGDVYDERRSQLGQSLPCDRPMPGRHSGRPLRRLADGRALPPARAAAA